MAQYVSNLHPEDTPSDVINPNIVTMNIPNDGVTDEKIASFEKFVRSNTLISQSSQVTGEYTDIWTLPANTYTTYNYFDGVSHLPEGHAGVVSFLKIQWSPNQPAGGMIIAMDQANNVWMCYGIFGTFTDWVKVYPADIDYTRLVRSNTLIGQSSQVTGEYTDIWTLPANTYTTYNYFDGVSHLPEGHAGVVSFLKIQWSPNQPAGGMIIAMDQANNVWMCYGISGTFTDWISITQAYSYPANFACAYKVIGAIGDSFTDGYINDTVNPPETNRAFSWPTYVKQIYGLPVRNFGVGGSSAYSWAVGVTHDWAELEAQGNLCQAYVIGLGINDALGSVPIGNISDIGTDAKTFYACYYKVIKRVLQTAPQADIFCNTCPFEADLTSISPYNAAIREIVSHVRSSENLRVYLVDLAGEYNNADFFRNPVFVSDLSYGHYTAVGYYYMADKYIQALSRVMVNYRTYFKRIYAIPYDEVT